MKKSSMFISLVITILFGSMVMFTGCTDNPVEPNNNFASVRLVPITNNMAKDIFTGSDGKEYLPARHLPALQKIAGSDISYGNINATTDMMYVLMNTGNVSVFNVSFSTNDILTIPGTIGLLEVSSNSSQISALPIVHIVKEHVKPYSTVGSLLPFEVGDFTDTLTLSYEYLDGLDTIPVADIYPVNGTKMGVVIDILFSGKKMQEYNVTTEYDVQLFNTPWSDWQLTNYWPFSEQDTDTSKIINSGNASIRVRVTSWQHSDVLVDQVLVANDTLNTSQVLKNTTNDSINQSVGEVILIGEKSNQPYMFQMAGQLITNGYSGIVFGQ